MSGDDNIVNHDENGAAELQFVATLWHNGRRAKQPGFIDARASSRRQFQKTTLKDSIVDLQKTLEICKR